MVKSLEGFTASLLLKLVEFQPDPNAAEKEARREDGQKWTPPLDTRPRLDDWEYHKLLTEGGGPLAGAKPDETARVLVDAVASMVRLRVHTEIKSEKDNADFSEIWCRRVHEPSRRFVNTEEELVHTLTYACECVFEQSPESVAGLNESLRNQPWRLFTRIRQHLYASFPIQ